MSVSTRRKGLFCIISCASLSACVANGRGSLLPAQTGRVPFDNVSARVAVARDDATPFDGGTSLVAVFAANYPTAARSASFSFALRKLAVLRLVKLAPGCGAGSSCRVTLTAPVGTDERLRVLLYASPDGKGSALAFASQTSSFFSGQTTTLELPLRGIMARYTVGLAPSTVTVGQTTAVTVVENAFDSAGEPLASGYVTTGFANPGFTLNVTDAAGLSTGYYSGVGSGPITYTVRAAGYASASSSLRFTPASPSTLGFAIVPGGLGFPLGFVFVYPPSATTPARTYDVPGYDQDPEEPRYDANGVLWLPTRGAGPLVRVGIKPNGEWAGTLPLPGNLLGFDRNGRLFVSDPTQNAVDVYSGNVLVRQIITPNAPYDAAVDRSGNVYASLRSGGVYEYGPSGDGDVTPIAVNTTAGGVETDGAGNVYGFYGGDNIGVWPSGTFGPDPPGTTYGSDISPEDFGVDDAGDMYATPSYANTNSAVYYAPAGSSSFLALPIGSNISTRGAAIAVPIK